MQHGLEGAINRLQQGVQTESDILEIVDAVNNREVTLAANTDGSVKITGNGNVVGNNNTINNVINCTIQPEGAGIIRERIDSSRRGTSRAWLYLISGWFFISLCISSIFATYSDPVINRVNQIFLIAGVFISQLTLSYYVLILSFLGILIMLGVRMRERLTQWLLLPVLIIIILVIYQTLLSFFLGTLQILSRSNFIHLFTIVLLTYSGLGIVGIGWQNFKVERELLLCIFCPFNVVLQFHGRLLSQLFRQFLG